VNKWVALWQIFKFFKNYIIMSTLRFEAVKLSLDRKPINIIEPVARRSELYGLNVFNLSNIKHFLPKDAYVAVMDAINVGKKN
jgi:glutamine synthetase